MLLLAATIVTSCSKKSNPTPKATNVIEYDFNAAQTNDFVVIYQYGSNGGGAQTIINTNSWSTKINLPDTTKTANINFSAAQEPPYTNNNSGTVTIKLNGKVVATGSGQFTNSRALAAATYTYNAQ